MHREPSRARSRISGALLVRRDRLRNRRGAVLVLIAFLMLGLVMLGAITVEASRVYVVRNELQTAADAAVMAGTIQLLNDVNAATTQSVAVQYASLNRVDNATGRVDTDSLYHGRWNPVTRRVDSLVSGASVAVWEADAVHAEVEDTVRLTFGRLLGPDPFILRASAAASWWKASVVRSQCIRPWALPYLRLLQAADPSHSSVSDSLTEDDLRSLRQQTTLVPTDRDGILAMPTLVTLRFAEPGSPSDSAGIPNKYYALNLGGGTSTDYMNDLQSCDPTSFPLDTTLFTDPDEYRLSTIKGTKRMCPVIEHFGFSDDGLDNDDHDVDSGTETKLIICKKTATSPPGVPIKVAFWDLPPAGAWTSEAPVRIKMLGYFVLVAIERWPDKRDIHGYFAVRQDGGPTGTGALAGVITPLQRPVLVR